MNSTGKYVNLRLLSAVILAAALLFSGCDSFMGKAQTEEKPRITAVTLTPTPAPTPEPAPEPRVLDANSEAGEDIALLQKRLAELGYMQAAATGAFDEATADAVLLFARHNGLAPTRAADIAMQALAFSEEAVSFAEAIAKLAPTTQMSFAELVGDNGINGYPKGYPAVGTYRITVDIANQVTLIYTKDENGEYTVPVRYMLSSTGTGSRTPVGTFAMNARRVRFSRFVRDGRYGQYWTQIYNAFYFHTMLYSKRDAATYLEDTFEELGSKASHGCVRLCVPDARWMWYHIAPGTVCEIRNGSTEDAETAAIRAALKLEMPPAEHLALEPGQIPDTDNWRIDDIPVEVPFKQGQQNTGKPSASAKKADDDADGEEEEAEEE